jgi:tRNA(Arg) A34 adenosine deaminase TadA
MVAASPSASAAKVLADMHIDVKDLSFRNTTTCVATLIGTHIATQRAKKGHHAEQKCLAKVQDRWSSLVKSKQQPVNLILQITRSPCSECATAITIFKGVREAAGYSRTSPCRSRAFTRVRGVGSPGPRQPTFKTSETNESQDRGLGHHREYEAGPPQRYRRKRPSTGDDRQAKAEGQHRQRGAREPRCNKDWAPLTCQEISRPCFLGLCLRTARQRGRRRHAPLSTGREITAC